MIIISMIRFPIYYLPVLVLVHHNLAGVFCVLLPVLGHTLYSQEDVYIWDFGIVFPIPVLPVPTRGVLPVVLENNLDCRC
jgi:hypothetical protein